jgi:hypothetical protein
MISVTTDGINYTQCEETFKIHSNKIFLESVAPKSGSVQGGTQLELGVNIDEETAKTLFHLRVGFQPAKKKAKAPKGDLGQSSLTKNQSVNETEDAKGGNRNLNVSQHSSVKGNSPNAANSGQNEGPQNPLDISPGDATVNEGAWV